MHYDLLSENVRQETRSLKIDDDLEMSIYLLPTLPGLPHGKVNLINSIEPAGGIAET